MRSRIALALLAAALAVLPAAAQDAPAPDSIREIHLADGSRIYGRVVEESGARIVIETVGGVRMELDRAQVRSTRPVAGRVVDGTLWPEDPHASRLFFGPTGRAIPAGEGYFGVYELFFPFLSYGVTDRFTISAGTPVFPEVVGRIFYVAPKVEVVRTRGFSGAVGALAIFATEDALDDGTVGLLYGVGTAGGPDGAITFGAAVPFYVASSDGEVGDQPVFMAGGEVRLTRRTKFLSENYLFASEGAAGLSAGIRFFGERLSADFGLGMGVGSGDSFCCLPLVNFVYSFGGR